MAVEQPQWLVGRQAEWAALEAFHADQRDGAALAVVRGRRRHGKSALLRAYTAAAGGWYHQATQGTAAEQRRDLGRRLAMALGVAAPLDLPDWDSALTVLLESSALPLLVVLDEFSYLVEADPSLPSLLQRWLDAHAHQGRRVRLVLCGSALSIMSGLLTGAAPLRGRATVELAVKAFDPWQAAEFHGVADPRARVQVQAVVGGVAGYAVDLLAGDMPASADDVDEWMIRGPLSVTRPLLYEARHLLDEPAIRDRAPYLTVLAAVASGASTNGAVAALMGRSSAAVAQTLEVLRDLELVQRREDVLRARRPTWTVADPLLRFWVSVMRPDWARIESGLARQVWRDAGPRWRAQVLGPAWEELVRRWAAGAEGALGPLRAVGRTVIDDPGARAQHELDVVGLDARSERPRVTVIGEAKLTAVGSGALARLEQIRARLVDRGLADDRTVLLLASFDSIAADVPRERDDVVLLTPGKVMAAPA